MDQRDRLREEVAVSSGMCLDALASGAGVDSIEAFAAAGHLVESAERTLHLFVAEARADGMTWAVVGEALGITRQAAQKRFGGQVPQKVTREPAEVPQRLVRLAITLLDDAAAGRFERIDRHASAHLRKTVGSAGCARAFEPVMTMFGELVSRGPVQAQLIGGRVAHVRAIEQRTLRPARAEVTLTLDARLLGINYQDAAIG